MFINLAVVAKWQTRWLQVPVGATPWRFDSSRPHSQPMKPPPIPLSSHEVTFRWVVIGAALTLGILLAIPSLGSLVFSDWPSPFHDLTGLPCPFCGMTRSGQSLLAGDLVQAFYYNALGPILASMAGLFIVAYAFELTRRTHLRWLAHLTQWLLRHVRLALAGLFVFWLLHLWLALSTPKPELFHPQGILLRWLSGN